MTAAALALWRLKWGVINRFSHCSVFVSKHPRDHFVRQGLAEPSLARVIYNGIDVDRFRRSPSRAESRRALGLPPEAFVVGCVGDLRLAKDYPTAIRAFSLIHRQLPQARMIVVGTKTELLVELLALRNGLGLTDAIDFIGFHPDITDVLPAFDVHLSSSVTAGFSLTIVEAMAAGLSVVSTRSGGPQQIVRHGETGLLVDVANGSGSPTRSSFSQGTTLAVRHSRSPGLGWPMSYSRSTPWSGPTNPSSTNSLQDESASPNRCADATQLILGVCPH